MWLCTYFIIIVFFSVQLIWIGKVVRAKIKNKFTLDPIHVQILCLQSLIKCRFECTLWRSIETAKMGTSKNTPSKINSISLKNCCPHKKQDEFLGECVIMCERVYVHVRESCAVAGTLAHIQGIYLNGMHFKLYKTKFYANLAMI